VVATYELGPRAMRVYTAVRERITGGEWVAGTKLPSHNEMAESYGVAPLTMRQVLARLEHEGLVSREQGRGTFVREPSRPTVLIVEDEPDVGELLAAHVRGAGALPILVSNVSDARAMLEAEPGIALVLSDVRLPAAEDGIGLIRTIRRRWPALPVAAVTAYPADLAGLLGTPESPVLILPKPFRPTQVREALGLALRLPSLDTAER
jgi:DNA-binding transcriptional regulator YhcF (GntR family)